jgi:LmbE family N-acetylglucosaminyl deacetylase
VKVVYTTSGDNNILSVILYDDLCRIILSNKLYYLISLILSWKEHFITLGNIRMREAVKAEKILGVDEKDLIFLGYPDHGTDQMFIFNWNHAKPFRESFGGHSAVPYIRSIGYEKGFTADNIVDDLKSVIADFRPTRIFVAHSSDVNGDHWASYLYVMAAISDLKKTIPEPKVYPYLVHVPNWPLPRHYHPELTIEPPEDFFDDILALNDWHQLKLDPDEIDRKHKAMLEHRSQVSISGFYLLAFVRRNEIFGDFPVITLKRQDPSGLYGKEIFTSDMQWIGYAVVGDSFWIRMKKPKEYKHIEDLTFFITGFRDDRPFSEMPNMLVDFEGNDFAVFDVDENKYVDASKASLEVGEDHIVFKMPLGILENPQVIIFGFEMNDEYMPAGCACFRIIKIE